MNYVDRLIKARGDLTQVGLSEKINEIPEIDKKFPCSDTYISRLERGGSESTKHKFDVHIALVTGVNPIWLTLGIGGMHDHKTDFTHEREWCLYLHNMARKAGESLAVPPTEEWYGIYVDAGLAIGLGNPVPNTQKEKDRFDIQLRAQWGLKLVK